MGSVEKSVIEKRRQKEETDTEFERQLESAKRVSVEEVVGEDETNPTVCVNSGGSGSDSEEGDSPVTKKKRRGYDSDESHPRKQTKRVRRVRHRRDRKKKNDKKRK